MNRAPPDSGEPHVRICMQCGRGLDLRSDQLLALEIPVVVSDGLCERCEKKILENAEVET